MLETETEKSRFSSNFDGICAHVSMFPDEQKKKQDLLDLRNVDQIDFVLMEGGKLQWQTMARSLLISFSILYSLFFPLG